VSAVREIVEFFRTLMLFRGLDTSELEDLARMVHPFVRDPGETLFRQGADSDGIYFLQYGLVEICARVPGDEVLTLARLENGNVFGEVGLLDSSRRTATALAISPTKGYLLGRRQFEILRLDFKSASLSIMQRLIENTCEAVRRSYERIGELLEEVSPLSRQPSETCSTLSRVDANGIPFGSLPFFSQLSTQELKDVLDSGRFLEAKRGTALYRQGALPQDIFIVVRGALRTILKHGNTRFQIAIHAPGSFDGVLGVLDGRPNATSCEACEPAQVLALNKSAVFNLQATRLPLSWYLTEHIHRELVNTLRQCRDHTSRLALERGLQARMLGASDV
jgi:CRP-like cAMP-binding protein